MKCVECDSEELMAKITITKFVPLANRGGSIKVGGQKLGQEDLKVAWDQESPDDPTPRKIRGPIFCANCGTEHYYEMDNKKNPIKGSYLDAIEALQGTPL